jgi:hypothetical protein
MHETPTFRICKVNDLRWILDPGERNIIMHSSTRSGPLKLSWYSDTTCSAKTTTV